MYFNIINTQNFDKKRDLIDSRKQRHCIQNNPSMGKFFQRGDIITISFWNKTFYYNFEGICLAIKNNKILNPNVMLTLRNVLFKVGVEVKVAYYQNRLFHNTSISDYKRKGFTYRSSKVYFLRLKENQATRIKN